MKIFFATVLVISLLCPLIMFASGLKAIGHNHYQYRHDLLAGRGPQRDHASVHLGLTQKELAACDTYVATAYRESVDDGYRLGVGYGSLTFQALAISALLFLTSAAG
ncbi:MAG: hypothetical protein ACREP9_10560, partial [Candidatus Dormibacteraceae bacterium]